MEPVFLGQPVFSPRPISPLNFEPFEPLPEDVILPGSSDEDSEGTRKRKKRRREDIGYQYLRQQAGYTITFKLKGPFENGWPNPYRDHGVVLTAAQVTRMRNRRAESDKRGIRASSPIDLTSGAEEDEVDGQLAARNLRDRKATSTANGWLKSNVGGIRKQQLEDVEPGSPTPGRQARVQQAATLVPTESVHKSVGVELSKPRHAIDHGEEIEDKLEEEELEELEHDEYCLEERRSPSVELEYSSQGQSRHRGASETSEGGHLEVKSPSTKPRLERRVLVKRIRDIRQRLRAQQYGSDTVDELLLEEEVLDDRISALSAVIADIKEAGTGNFTKRKKRSRNHAQNNTPAPDLLVIEQKRVEEASIESLPRAESDTRTNKVDMRTTEIRELPPLSLQNPARPNRGEKAENEGTEQSVQVEIDPNLIRVPSFRTDSSEMSLAVSSESNGKKRSARAIRKSEKRREQKRAKRQKAAREKLARQQGEDNGDKNADEGDGKIKSTKPFPPAKALLFSTKTEQPRRPRECELGWDFGERGPVPGQPSIVDDEEMLDDDGNFDVQQNEERIAKPETIEQARRPARKKYQSEAKDTEAEMVVGNNKVMLDVRSSEAIAAGAKGERVPIIIIDDYDSHVSSSQVSLNATCPTGWKPYKWLHGGQVYAERVLREHLASIEAGGPSLDPFRSSVDSSSNESPKAERERNVRETNTELQRLSNDNIIDLTDFEMPEAPPAAAQLKSSGIEVGFDNHHMTLEPQEVNRRASVDSVDTAWKKDQSSFFSESLNSGANELAANRQLMRQSSRHKPEIPTRSERVARNDLTSIPKAVLGQFNNEAREPSTVKKEVVLSKDGSNEEVQKVKITEEEKRASEALTASLVSFMDTSSEHEAGGNDPHLYAHSPEGASPCHDQATSDSGMPTKAKVQSGPTRNVLAVNNYGREAPLVTVDKMALDDVDDTAVKGFASAKELTTGTPRNKKDQRKPLNERRSSREEFLQSLRLHVTQKAGKNLLTAGLDTTALSPHVLPASTNLSQFQYNRVDSASRSASSDYNPPQRKQRSATPVNAKAQGKRRISFTPNGNIKRDIEIRVASLSPQGSQASPIVIEEAPARIRASPPKKNAPSLIQKRSESDTSKSIADILPEAQVVAEKLPSGPSTNLLETDKQSLKFQSTEEHDSSEQFSTQAELAKAQQSFQRDLQSPPKPLVRRTSTSELHRDDDPSRTPLLTSKDPYIGAPRRHSSSQELPSTQAMVDAMSPFAISTTKKPGRIFHALTRPAAAVYGYIWGGSQEEPAAKPEPVETSALSESAAHPTETSADLPTSPKLPEPTLEPAVTFAYPAFDMATSDESNPEPAYVLSQPSDFVNPPRRTSRKLNSTLRAEDEESDFEETQKQRRLVRDDRGRWTNLTTELSMVTPSQRTLRSFNSPRTGSTRKRAEQGQESLSQDGQRRSGLEAAIDEAENWLGTWDVEGEMRKIGQGASGSGSGSGVARKGPRNTVVL
ncbi:hypothetical protein MMC18_004690 [Xylographa bjoerkii]|nr:hypothetical protein [Xylographa bjoerkii]